MSILATAKGPCTMKTTLITVKIDGVEGSCIVPDEDARHICGQLSFNEKTDTCPRCEANNRAAEDARKKNTTASADTKGKP